MGDWIEVQIDSSVDSGELLGMLNDPAVAGAWHEDRRIRLYWSKDREADKFLPNLKRVVAQLGGDPNAVTIETVPDRDWNALWARSVKPLRIGRRIVIRPSWEQASLQAGDIELVLDPKQAFGTGHHATTQLLIEWLEDLISGGEQVLDVGTGSGILAMVALRLGARRALGIDHDPVAIECAREYAMENRFGSDLELCVATLAELNARQFDLVLANLDRQALLECSALVPQYLRPGGILLLSGLLSEDRQEVEEAYVAAGGTVHQSREREGWLALSISFPGTHAS